MPAIGPVAIVASHPFGARHLGLVGQICDQGPRQARRFDPVGPPVRLCRSEDKLGPPGPALDLRLAGSTTWASSIATGRA
jgi:hypothetical protein